VSHLASGEGVERRLGDGRAQAHSLVAEGRGLGVLVTSDSGSALLRFVACGAGSKAQHASDGPSETADAHLLEHHLQAHVSREAGSLFEQGAGSLASSRDTKT
jgi:hypothetical protein